MPTSRVIKSTDNALSPNLVYCPETEAVTYNPTTKLTPIELTLLKKLLKHRGRVVTLELLEEHIYADHSDKIQSNTLAVHIHNLRRKFPGINIQSIRGVGYVLKESLEHNEYMD